jgi:hypothetical protein
MIIHPAVVEALKKSAMSVVVLRLITGEELLGYLEKADKRSDTVTVTEPLRMVSVMGEDSSSLYTTLAEWMPSTMVANRTVTFSASMIVYFDVVTDSVAAFYKKILDASVKRRDLVAKSASKGVTIRKMSEAGLTDDLGPDEIMATPMEQSKLNKLN